MKQIDEVKLAAEETLHNNNVAAELARHGNVLNGLLQDMPVTPPVTPINDYTKNIRYQLATHAYKMGLAKPGFVQSFPDQKGGPALAYIGSSAPTLGLPYVTKDGLLFIQNQKDIRYVANIKGDGDHTDNNEYVGFAEIFHTPVLTDAQASQVTTELQGEYKALNLPIATDLTYTVSGGNVTVSYKCAILVASAKIRWVNIPSGPESSVYLPQYDGKWTIPAVNPCRAEITVYDNAGNYFDIPSTKYFKP